MGNAIWKILANLTYIIQAVSLSDMFIINLTKRFNFLGDLNSGVNQEFESFDGIHYNQH